jgi:hypothetical protein
MTPSGIEPAFFRFVAQYLDHCATISGPLLFPNWQKESWQTFEETSGYVRPERVNKWPNSMTDYMMMMNMMMILKT